MTVRTPRNALTAIVIALTLCAFPLHAARADDLTRQIQTDLKTLGYYSGPLDGKKNMDLQMAIGRFQKANGMRVTGEATFPLAVEISDKAAGGKTGAGTPTQSAEQRKAEQQQACLEKKQQQAQAAQKSKRMWSSLSNVGRRVAGRMGEHEVARGINEVNATAYDVSEVSSVAKEFGISNADARECINR